MLRARNEGGPGAEEGFLALLRSDPEGTACLDPAVTVAEACGATPEPPPPPPVDVVTIIKAEYKSNDSEIKVEATSSEGGSVTLTVVGYGDMTYKADKDKFELKAKPVGDPGASVDVISSGGGEQTIEVTYK